MKKILDAEPEQARGALLHDFPDSQRLQGSFARYEVAGSEVLDEVIFFRDVRSGRVNSVILKYRADLTPRDQEDALRLFGVDIRAAASSKEGVAEEVRGGLRLRALPRDRQGRLTLTAEAAPES